MGVSGKKKCWRYITKYDYCASNPDIADKIPGKIHRHIKKCSYCSKTDEQILRYLAQQSASQQPGKSSTEKLSALAQKHFESLGKMVDCKTVKPFLPLLLGPHRDITIPTPITVHKAECDQCTEDYSLLSTLDLTEERLNGLAKFFSDPTRYPDCLDKDHKLNRLIYDIADRDNSDVITCYELAPVTWDKDDPNAPVDCKVLKTFLPQFAGNELELTIPSALSDHISQCDQCRSDLETMTNLKLTTIQLTDLKGIFRAETQRTNINFSQTHQQTDVEKLEGQLNCEEILPRSLFDHCFPHLTLRFRPEYEIIKKLFLTGQSDEDTKIDDHISKCRNCQARVQQLHKTISTIAQRGNTDVLTANDTPVPEQRQGFFALDYQYANYPIKV